MPSTVGKTLQLPSVPPAQRDGAPSGEALAMELKPDSKRGHLTLGRDPEADLHINDATLSRTHLVFMARDQGGWTVRDAGSSNGSWVNGQALVVGQPNQLADGSQIRAGQVYLTYAEPESLFTRLRKVKGSVAASKQVER
jgi:predicted component of type VI protein secretion system